MTKAIARRSFIAAGAAASLLPLRARSQTRPSRIVSLNPCIDTMLIDLVDVGRIAALSHYARDPITSTIADRARSLPVTYESAEEILALDPDLVLASRHSNPATRAALERFGIRVDTFTVPDTVEDSLAQVERIAASTGDQNRGADIIARVRSALENAAPRDNARPRALVFQPRGFVAGSDTLIDDLLHRTGFANMAARYGIRGWGHVALEALLADPPDLLLTGEVDPSRPDWADRVLRHPALQLVAGRMQRAVYPQRLLYCGGPVLTEGAARLLQARHAWLTRA